MSVFRGLIIQVEAELPEVDAPSLMPGWGTWSNQQREPRWMREKREQAEKVQLKNAEGRVGWGDGHGRFPVRPGAGLTGLAG